MGRYAEGTTKWFESALHQCVDHLRALLSIQMAHDYMTVILDESANSGPLVLAGLHSACVIAYARPFTPAQTKKGRVTYKITALKRAYGFDRELHFHLLELRDRLVAHADYALLSSTMYLQLIGDEKLPVAAGLNVKTIFGIGSRELGERYQNHFRICVDSIKKTLDREFRELAAQTRKYPTEFQATNNVSETMSEWTPTTELNDLPGPIGPAAGVAEPSFPDGLTEYRYFTIRHHLPLLGPGKHTFHTDEVERHVEVSLKDDSSQSG